MPSFFSRLKGRDGPAKVTKSKKGAQQTGFGEAPPKPKWEDPWTRRIVEPEEVQELVRGCTLELKSRALDMPFLLLPFRPTSDPSAARSFIRNFFDRAQTLRGEDLTQELRLSEPMVLCSVVKWCWSRLPGGVVGWEAYELFKIGEQDSNMARDSFATFIPLSVESDSRTTIIFDFFDLLAAVAAHAKSNGLGGRKLSRLAGWWAFEHNDTGNGFDGGYKAWVSAADAASHLFFAYLRSLSPDTAKSLNGISTLPMSLQKLVQETEYPPERPSLLQSTTRKVVMIVDSVSPTPFALLRRANHFQYRDDDRALQAYAEYEDPVKALTDECRRVLRSISTANQSQVLTSKTSTGLSDSSWSRFEDVGFSAGFDESFEDDEESSFGKKKEKRERPGLRSTPQSRNTLAGGRPTTPSWADFLSSGFVDEAENGPAPLLLPPDKVLPPIDTRGRSSQSHKPKLDSGRQLEPGELASITKFDLDDTFWWVWISSLAGEETGERKAAFGRCALIETIIRGGRWLVMEEMVKGAAAAPEEGAYIAEKKSFWGRSKKNKTAPTRRKSLIGHQPLDPTLRSPGGFAGSQGVSASKTSVGPDQHARIAAAAAQLQQKQRQQNAVQHYNARRGRKEPDMISQKTDSVFTLQPVIMSEASPAMKWASKYDKDEIQAAYLANKSTGKGMGGQNSVQSNGFAKSQDTLKPYGNSKERDLPAVPQKNDSPSITPAPSFPPTPGPVGGRDIRLSEKAVEIGLPDEPHPVDRKTVGGPVAPIVKIEKQPAQDMPRFSVEIRSSPENKHKKLQKKEASAGGFKKLFGRNKNRQSQVPENASEALKSPQGNLQPPTNGLARKLSNMKRKSPVPSPVSESTPSFATSRISEDDPTPVQTPHINNDYQRSYDPSLRDSLSRVSTGDAQEARHAFSRFDQGPLDVPAFVPDDSPRHSEDDSVTPTLIARDRSNDRMEIEEQIAPASPTAIPSDRWAQIRKNAAERAAQRQSEEQSRGGQSQRTDDGETSGEETIESRVARIKARVAELTGNMEIGSSPAPPSVPRRT